MRSWVSSSGKLSAVGSAIIYVPISPVGHNKKRRGGAEREAILASQKKDSFSVFSPG